MTRLSTCAGVMALAVTVSAQAPATPQALGAISGVVVDALTNEPVENAAVTVVGANAARVPQARQYTDAKGRFVFVNLPASPNYLLTAEAPGFFTGVNTRELQPTSANQPLVVTAGEWVRDVRLALWRHGAISGRVLNEFNEPMVGVFVRALRRVLVAGRDRLVAASVAITDDRGQYRVSGLATGKYVVQVPAVAGPPPSFLPAPPQALLPRGTYPAPTYPITFFPSARTRAEGGVVEVTASEERNGVDIVMTAVSTFTVSGTITGPTAGLTLRLLLAGLETTSTGSEVAAAEIATDGSFTFVNVPEGAYVLDVRRSVSDLLATTGSSSVLPRGVPTTSFSMNSVTVRAAETDLSLSTARYNSNTNAALVSARVPVTVNGADVKGLVVTPLAGSTIEGSLVVEGASGARPSLVSLVFEPVDGEPYLGAPPFVQRDSALRAEDVGAGAYFVRAQALSTGWALKSIMWNGADYTERPIDIAGGPPPQGLVVTITDRAASIMGRVAETAAAVIVFPVDAKQWRSYGLNPPRLRSTFTDAAGSYRLADLPAGDYFVAAVPVSEARAWVDPDYLARLAPQATRVTLTWGDTFTQALSLVMVRR